MGSSLLEHEKSALLNKNIFNIIGIKQVSHHTGAGFPQHGAAGGCDTRIKYGLRYVILRAVTIADFKCAESIET